MSTASAEAPITTNELPRAANDAAFPSGGEIRARMMAQNREVLLSRSIAVVWIILSGTVTFSAAKLWFEPATSPLWYVPAFSLGLLQVVMLGLLRREITTSRLEHIMLADTAATCAVAAWVGAVAGHTTSADYLIMGLAINTAAILPWGPRSQAGLAAIAAAAIVANGYGISGNLLAPVDFRTMVPAVVLSGASIYTASILQTARLENARVDLLRRRAEAEIRDLNATLERRVVERTAELQAANAELESFAYSVSHDLRAPLRAMDGISEILQEDYAGNMDATGRDYLDRIRGEARRLGHLVDDLLRLSGVARAVLRRADVDLSALASSIAESLRASAPDRDVQFTIAPGLRERCDGSLVRILLDNLLGNAFKFTRLTPCARIEFGAEHSDEERVYFVRDNGVGFDMSYVGKIFRAFERLHGADEFEGTGIGLATVYRIVHRHGGVATALAQPGEGATFRFTLRPAGEGAS